MPPPNTPVSESRVTSLRDSHSGAARFSRPGDLPHPDTDLRNAVYTTVIDENLLCPICHVPLVEPVTTRCDHTFCNDCFLRAYRDNPTCPIDRSPLVVPVDLERTPKIVVNQLDGLQIRCPNKILGCQVILPRSILQNHLERYCANTLVDCPDKTCGEPVFRKDISRDCLHYDTTCPDCGVEVEMMSLQFHREHGCTERKGECEHCGVEVLRCQLPDHLKECPEVVTHCKWEKYGCQYKSKRKDLGLHTDDCSLKSVGPMAEMLVKEIASLRDDVQSLMERDKIKDRRIKFLEGRLEPTSHPDVVSLPGPSPEEEPYDSRDQYLLSLLESQESRVDQLSAGMTEIEAKQTMMLFNETMPIKEQLAELRSAQGVIGMHVRWLMNFRLQEKRPGPGGPKPPGGAGPSDLQPLRKLSDTRENITKL